MNRHQNREIGTATANAKTVGDRLAKRLLLDGLSIGGFLFGLVAILFYRPEGLIVAPDLAAYLRAGHDFLAGAPVYISQVGEAGAFSYAPPCVMLAAALTFLPPLLAQLFISLASVAALRYVVGSWRAVGWSLWWPVTSIVIISGNIDLIIAAAMVAAWRGRPTALALMGLTKIAPLLGLPPRSWWRSGLRIAAVCVLTLPWWHLWPEWVGYLLSQPANPTYALAIPWWMRLPVALGLVAMRRPWASAAAVVVGMPFLYAFTTMELLAVLRIAVMGSQETDGGPGQHHPDPASVPPS
jgi:hypothetical protein